MKRKFTFLLTAALLLISLVSWGQTYTWNLVTDASTLAAGDVVIIAASGYDYAISTTQNTNNRGQAAITKSGTTCTLTADVQELTLENGTTSGTLAFYAGNGYLYAASSSSNYLRTETTLSANSSWAITINNGVTSVVAQGSFTRKYMQYNSGSSIFACYSSASQKAVCIYKRTVAGPTQLDTPANFAGVPGDASIAFTWNAVDNASSYTISYTPEGGSEQTVSASASPYTLTGLTNGTEYTCKIMAVGDGTNYTNSNYSDPAITVTPSSTPTCTPPQISVTGTSTGNDDEYYATAQVTLETITEGASIYYTTNGTDPDENSTPYAAPFDITGTATVKAIAILSGYNNSTIASKAIAILPVSTIAEARALADDATVVTKGVVTYVSGSNAYIEDANAGILLYTLGLSSNVALGDEVIIGATKTTYQEQPELESVIVKVKTQTSVTLPVQNVTIADLAADFGSDNLYQHRRVKLTEVLMGSTTDNVTTISQNANTTGIKYMPAATNINDEGYYVKEIYAIVGRSADAMELRVNSATDFVQYTVDASSNNTSYGTVETNGYVITATPATGYGYADPSYTILVNDGKIGTVTQTDNEFKVVTNDDECTVKIQFAAVPTHTVTYMVNGVAATLEPSVVTEGAAIGTLPTPDAASIPSGFSFVGWSTDAVTTVTDTKPATIIDATHEVNADATLYAVFGIVPQEYELVGINDISASDVVVITMEHSDGTIYAMSNNNAAGAAPTATLFTISSNLGASYEWNIANNNGNLTIYPNGTTESWLYATTSNNGVRVGTNTTNGYVWTIDGNYLTTNDGTNDRLLGVYNKADWRSYKVGSTTNIANQTLGFYRKPAAHSYTTSVNLISQNIEIASGGTITINQPTSLNGYTLTIAAGATVTVTSVLANTNPSNLVIADGGQLIHSNAGVQATAQKSISAYSTEEGTNDGWYTIASPVNNMAISNAFMHNNFDLYRYNEGSFTWENKENTNHTDFTNFENGRGYLYANSEEITPAFVGELNSSAVTVSLTASGTALKGFNLIGNPFMHNIYKGTGAAIDNSNLANGYYVLTNAGAWTANQDTEPILPGQGIFVQTSTATELTINKTTAASGSRSQENGSIKIEVANDKYQDVAYISFGEGKGLNKINHRNEAIQMVYIPQNGTNYAIANVAADCQSVPVGFKSPATSYYTITVNPEGKFSYLHLIDRESGEDIDMLAKESYKFIGTPSDIRERFVIAFNNNGIGDSPVNSSFNCFYDNGLVITGFEGNAEISIFDIQGRLVKSYSATGSFNKDINLSNGVYVVRVTDNAGSKTQKIVVNN